MTATPFDLQALFREIDAEREHQSLSWAALARQVGVAASTIRRFGEADDAEADGVLACDSRGSQGRTRSSIQSLVAVAQQSEQPVGALTRLSDG